MSEPLTITVRRRGRGFEATVSGGADGFGQLSQPGLTPDDAIGRVMRMTAHRFEKLGLPLDFEPGLYTDMCRSCGGSGCQRED